jgi:hypothetical protein
MPMPMLMMPSSNVFRKPRSSAGRLDMITSGALKKVSSSDMGAFPNRFASRDARAKGLTLQPTTAKGQAVCPASRRRREMDRAGPWKAGTMF